MSYSTEKAIKISHKYLPVFEVNTYEYILLQLVKQLQHTRFLCLRVRDALLCASFSYPQLHKKIQKSLGESGTLETYLSTVVKKKARNSAKWQKTINEGLSYHQLSKLRNDWIDKILAHNKDSFRQDCSLSREDMSYLLRAYQYLPVFSITAIEAEVLREVKYAKDSYLCYRLNDYCQGLNRIHTQTTCSVLQDKIHEALGQAVFITGFLSGKLPSGNLSDNCRRVLRDLWIEKLIENFQNELEGV